MNTVVRTDVFDVWLKKLKDVRGKARILKRIRSAERGNFGDIKFLAADIWEMRIHTGPGYRVYYTRRGDVVYALLCGGSKCGQKRDIARARKLLEVLNRFEP